MKMRFFCITLLINLVSTSLANAQLRLVGDLSNGASSTEFPGGFWLFNNHVYFKGFPSGASPGATYRTDGYSIVTTQSRNEYSLLVYKGSLYSIITDDYRDFTLMRTDDKGNSEVFSELDAYHLTVFDNELYFMVVGANGKELWKSDGTAEGTMKIKDVALPFQYLGNTDFFEFNGKLLFNTINPTSKATLWCTDGTSEGTVRLLPEMFAGHGFTSLKGQVYFCAWTSETGSELWRTDGTPEGTVLVRDMYAGVASSDPRILLATNDFIFYTTTEGGFWGLYSFDGTTHRHLDNLFLPGLAALLDNNRAFFMSPYEIWISEGMPENTERIHQFNENFENPPTVLGVFDGHVFFSGTDSEHGAELWTSDGTAQGTHLLLDVNPGPDSSDPQHGIDLDNQFLITASDNTHGRELWSVSRKPQIGVIQNGESVENGSSIPITTENLLVEIVNNGLLELSINDIIPDGDMENLVIIAPEQIDLSYGEASSFEIRYVPSGEASSATVTLKSNDPVTPEFHFTISAPPITSTAKEISATEVWPNPSQGQFSVTTLPLDKIECYDLMGRPISFELVERTPEKSTLFIESNGVFMLQIKSGNQNSWKKIVVKK